jgi:hypothetical protein
LPATVRRADAASAFFEAATSAWNEAAARAGAIEKVRIALGERTLELRFAGGALVPALSRAFGHLDEGSGATLVVRVFESETTGVPIPRPPWRIDDYREHGRIRGFCDDRFQTVFHWGSGSLQMLDRERDEALYWVSDAGQVPSEAAAPFRSLIHGWLAPQGIELVHAAAVGDPSQDACVLLVGKSGVGKSTTALAATGAGLAMLADDYCLLGRGVPPRVASVYGSAKADAATLERLPFLAESVADPQRLPGEKALCFPGEGAPARLLAEAELRAVLVPRIARTERTSLRPASSAAALAALAPSTLLQLAAADGATLARLAEVVASVPSYSLELGGDPADIGPAIAPLLS